MRIPRCVYNLRGRLVDAMFRYGGTWKARVAEAGFRCLDVPIAYAEWLIVRRGMR